MGACLAATIQKVQNCSTNLDEASEAGRAGGEGSCTSLPPCVRFGAHLLAPDGPTVGPCGCAGRWGEAALEARAGGTEPRGCHQPSFHRAPAAFAPRSPGLSRAQAPRRAQRTQLQGHSSAYQWGCQRERPLGAAHASRDIGMALAGKLGKPRHPWRRPCAVAGRPRLGDFPLPHPHKACRWKTLAARHPGFLPLGSLDPGGPGSCRTRG